MADSQNKLGAKTPDKSSGVDETISWIKQGKLLTICFWVIGGLCLVSVGLTGAIIFMLPLKSVETVFVHVKSAEENFVILQKANKTLQSKPALISDYLRIYVSHREMVDKVTEKIRYQRVKAMSTKDVGDTFQDIITDKKLSPFLKPHFLREIKIITDIPLARGIHQITFERKDHYDDKPRSKAKITRWVATIHYRFADQKTKYSRKYLNPLGLFVDQYNITQARSRGDE